MADITITLPDGSTRVMPNGTNGAEIAAAIGPGLAKAALAVKVDGAPWDLSRAIEDDAAVEILTIKSEGALAEAIAECLTGPAFYTCRVPAKQIQSPEQHGRCHACA